MVLTEELAFIPSFQSSSFSIWGFLSGLITPPHIHQDRFIRDSLGLGVSCIYKTFCCSSRKASKFTGNADVLRNDDCTFKVTEGKKMEVAHDFHHWLGANNRNLCRHSFPWRQLPGVVGSYKSLVGRKTCCCTPRQERMSHLGIESA